MIEGFDSKYSLLISTLDRVQFKSETSPSNFTLSNGVVSSYNELIICIKNS